MLRWYEQNIVYAMIGSCLALLLLAFSSQLIQPLVEERGIEEVVVIGFEKEGLLQTWKLFEDPTLPVGVLLKKIALDDVDLLEISLSKQIGSLRNRRLILPKIGKKSAVFEEKREGGQIIRFDLPITANKQDLMQLVEGELGYEKAQSILRRKRTLFHLEHFFYGN